jgi:hypothetical protein
MRKAIAVIAAAFPIVALAVPCATAATTEVNVRIEGKSETLFEGPILAEPHGVRAASDPIALKIRRCDSTNPLNPEGASSPAPTPTAVSADAMSLIGETFDGQHYDELEDYFLTRWGPDAQNLGSAAYWGILVNDVFAPVGGCQYPLDGGDEVLWVYDAFKGRPALALFPELPAYSSGPKPLTTVLPAQPLPVQLPVEVVSYADDEESKPPASPGRTGSSGLTGAKVAPVITSSKGFQRVDATNGATVTTGPAGKASVTFTTPGWHRIKATIGSPGSESVIRSNRLDVCVPGGSGIPLEGAVDCSELPKADQARTPDPTFGELEEPRRRRPAKPGGAQSDPPPPVVAEAIRLTTPRLDRGKIGQGRVGVSWRVLDPGPGVKSWAIASQTLGRKGARYMTRASGAQATSATLRLPPGRSYRLRFTITDLLGRSSTVGLGKVTVPGARRR